MKISITPIQLYLITFLSGIGFVSALAMGSKPVVAVSFALGLTSFIMAKMRE